MTKHQKAKDWRTARKLSVADLSALTGYSIEAIYAFERGRTPKRTWKVEPRNSTAPAKIQDWVWLRYKNACRGVEADLRTGKQWDWS